MQELVAAGLMRSLGKVAWCQDEYFTITAAGREAMREWRAAQPALVTPKKRRESPAFAAWRIHQELGYDGGFGAFWRDVWPTAKYQP